MSLVLDGKDKKNIEIAADYIKRGGLVVFPTETVYGLGANALNKIAVAKVFEAKNRPYFDPLIVHIHNKNELTKYVKEINQDIEKLINSFWPGPLTIVLPKKEIIPDIVTSGLDKVGIRIPNNEIALKLIEASEVPIAAPSANPFNYISPTTIHIPLETLKDKVDVILDGGKTNLGIESTIISFDEKNNPILLRPGSIETEKIEKLLNKKVLIYQKENIIASGQTKHHYKPSKPLFILKNINPNNIDYNIFFEFLKSQFNQTKKIYLLLTFYNENVIEESKKYNIKIDFLSLNNNYYEIAANLFEKLYLCDKSDKDIIIINEVEPRGLGLAIMNRLEKAKTNYIIFNPIKT